MREIERIAGLLEQTFEGKAYYGNSVLKTLEGITSEVAVQKPENGKNSIRDIVAHLTLELVYHRKVIEGTAEKWVAGETTWEKDRDYSDEDWNAATDALKTANRALVEAIKQLSDDVLDKQAVQVSGTYYRMLNGVLQHGIYHSGQISVLKQELEKKSKISKS